MSVKTHFTSVITTSINSVNERDWNTVVNDRNIYLTIPYLKALEETRESEIDIYYAVVYSGIDNPVLVAVFQLVTFEYRKSGNQQALLRHVAVEKKEDGSLAMNLLVCGNVFSDGENGFLWTSEISEENVINQIVEITKRIKRDKKTLKKLSVVLFKEFWPESVAYSDLLKQHKYTDFMIDVNMVLPIHASWNSMDDYLFSMKTKFRTKANSAYRKSRSLEARSMMADEIIEYEDRINELFNNVLERSNYSFGKIYAVTYAAFKEYLGESFSFRGLFHEGKLVGFSTAFFNNEIMEANYVGIDYDCNLDYAVYQRLLYDYVDQAITRKAKELQLGRTSELIKSSLGAQPINMKLYAKHKIAITNLLMSSILGFVSPSKFELRQPFKANFKNS